MFFDVGCLGNKWIEGLKELQKDYEFSLDGGIMLSAQKGEAGLNFSDNKVVITYQKECEFYREFVKLLNGEKHVKEKCAFQRFGIMLDCSRNAVATLTTLKRLIRLLAVTGYDTLELYMEDLYEVDGEPLFGYLRGRYSKSEMKDVDAYGKKFGVEVVPCIQTLAHLKGITRWPRFIPLIDCTDIMLAGDEKVYELIDKMLGTLSECFTSRRIHLGMDEANLLGAGRYLAKNGYADRFDIMIAHLKRVLEIAKKYNYDCAMWSDLLFSISNGDYYDEHGGIPERVLSQLPKDVTLTYWDYDHNQQEDYEKMLAKHKKTECKIAFAGGVLKWNNFTAANSVAIKRNEASMSACKKFGIDEVMFTLWGDDGAESSSLSVLPALVSAAEFAYESKDVKDACKRITGVEFDDFMSLELVNQPLKKSSPFYSSNCSKMYLYNDLFAGIFDFTAKPEFKEGFLASAKRIKEAGERAGEFSYLFKSMSALANLVAEKYDFGVKLRQAYKDKDKEKLSQLTEQITSLLEKTEIFYNAFKEQWYKENKSIGFYTQDIRLGGLKQRLAHCQEILREYLAGKISEIPELDERLINPYVNFEELDKTFMCYQWWQEIVSVNFIAL